MAINTLLPKKLTPEEDSYQSVKELDEVLSSAEKERIKNIALTGPFGSGKSSVLVTLIEDFPNGRNYLPISLATLQANDENSDERKVDEKSATELEKKDCPYKKEEKKENPTENLNRKIEYSILQQLIYREKTKTVPNSRFRRIVHLSKCELIRYSICAVLSLICFLILFEPAFAKVESIYNFFCWGKTCNLIFDFIAAVYLLIMLFIAIRYIFKSYSNSKLNKLNLKDAEIEIVENNSIFNRHLDEILYFFQVTEYNVVIIEDLDRFDTPNIFLKLRELNQLINESKIVGRHITFIYAVKDDIFKNEERTKFFDYIITVIPVINPSNSKDKLKAALKAKGCEDEISDDDLSEMAFFIQDMRILTNIVNEYKQYRDKLCTTNGIQLNRTKLLAMIVYKNYYPQDFALLHRREGKIYQCISSKRLFISNALENLKRQKKELEQKEKDFYNNQHLKIKDLRLLLLYKWKETINKAMVTIEINNNNFSLEQIADSDELFNKLLSIGTIRYSYNYYYSNETTGTCNNNLVRYFKDEHFFERETIIKSGEEPLRLESKRIQNDITRVKSLRIKELLAKYDLGKTDAYNNIGLTDMQDVFIRLGYIDEDYYDYISYFYPEMLSLSDRELLLNIKRQIDQPYDTHIDKIVNFVKELKDYMFESDAILNIELLDYLASQSDCREKFEHVMYRLEHNNAPLNFLSQYYAEGKQCEIVFKHYIEYTYSWGDILKWENAEERKNLIEAYLRYSPKVNEESQTWLNENFEFFVNHVDGITLDKALKLVTNSRFVKLCEGSDDVLDCTIEHSCYEINLNNLCVVTQHLCRGNTEVSSENLNYTRICDTRNHDFIAYVQDNIALVLQETHDCNKDESPESILYILNSTNIENNIKKQYLMGQHNVVDLNDVNETTTYEIAIETKVVRPTWKNISLYYTYKGSVCNRLSGYINHYAEELSQEEYPETLKYKNELYAALYGGDTLSLDNYTKLLPSFTGVFPQIEQIDTLERERLLTLIKFERLPFDEVTLAVINRTTLLGQYIVFHSKAFVEHLDWDYDFDVNSVLEILKYDEFSLDEKYNIIEVIPDEILLSSQQIADIVIDVFCKKGMWVLDSDTMINLLRTSSSDINKKLQIATIIIRNSYYDKHTIETILNEFGEEYADICDTGKRAKLPNTDVNKSLLSALNEADFISRFKEEGENGEYLRVFHKRVH